MEVAEKTFHETAATWGLAVAVLIFVAMGLGFILWKLGNRLIDSHEKFLNRQIEASDKTAAHIEAIKDRLPLVCQAVCPTEQPDNGSMRKRLA
jgi:hypothetical protein